MVTGEHPGLPGAAANLLPLLAFDPSMDGNPVFVAFMSDISARKTVELALREARQAAEDANHEKSDYLSRMSHELRTPLTAILGYADLLALDNPREDQQVRVEAILRATSHLLSLINDVLDI